MVSPNSLDANQHLRSQKVKELIDYCEKCSQQGEALDVSQVAFKTILNLANPFSDWKVDELKDVIWRITNEVGKINLVDFFPILNEKIDFQGIRVDHDVKLFDYIIPKGSLVLVNVWAIGRDSTFWEEPLIFKPERFQSLELDVRGKDFELIPFGAGRRICPGLPLALRMVQVMLGSMLNSFNGNLEAGIDPKDLDMDENFGFITPKAHPLRVIPSPL
ncbi:hypothetical protein MTR67_041880 [Solanum verrucosum]|uniref:Cytochrome P450 n=1 Tax=Solanum verrucosum TaxID=315347 RepID=A0AAF0UMF8_SOLVR|nr:hypothetical protein MTR67_041880 [Solanum verrucosum]